MENTHQFPDSLPCAPDEGKVPSCLQIDSDPTTAPKKIDMRETPKSTTTSRGRIVSLDRDMEGTDVAMKINATLVGDNLDDNSTVTSDGESSYFAKDLPSPKSGRRYSFSDAASASSAPARAGFFQAASYRESDASLSFSDDDEEEDDEMQDERVIHSRSPLSPPPVAVGVGIILDGSQMYQLCGITRMHSASSLVSSKSGREEGPSTPNDPLPGGDDDSDAELEELNPQLRSAIGISDRQSGRNPPESVHNIFFSSPTNPQSPPPTILGVGCPDMPILQHPQPQPMAPQQLSAWMTSGSAAAHELSQQRFQNFMGYGATFVVPPILQPSTASAEGDPVYGNIVPISAGNQGSGSHGNLQMVYSEDEETDEGKLVHKLSIGKRKKQSPGDVEFLDKGSRANVSMDGHNFHEVVDKDKHERRVNAGTAISSRATGEFSNTSAARSTLVPQKDFQIYWQRWLMLFLMSALNLLSDWTCYSVAPIAMLTSEAFGQIDPEQLVVVFLAANVVSTACEPVILSRLGLRRTIVFGSLLLMVGSVIKSGGFPPIIKSNLEKGRGEWRVYLGFFLVGLSQPLYQCTPALLSASWFPEQERTIATGVALNANQLGIGFAFIFGTLLVSSSDDIVSYFGLLSIVSTVCFIGTLLFFDDAPPTPPSDTARVMRGTYAWRLPNADSLWKSVRSVGVYSNPRSSAPLRDPEPEELLDHKMSVLSKRGDVTGPAARSLRTRDRIPRGRKLAAKASTSSARRRTGASDRGDTANTNGRFEGSIPSELPSSASIDRPVAMQLASWEHDSIEFGLLLPSPMLSGELSEQTQPSVYVNEEDSSLYENLEQHQQRRTEIQNPSIVNQSYGHSPQGMLTYHYHPHGSSQIPGFYTTPPASWPYQNQPQYYDPHFQHLPYHFQGHHSQQRERGYPPMQGYSFHPSGNAHHTHSYPPKYYDMFGLDESEQPLSGTLDDGAEPTLTVSDHRLDINIRDDQVILSIRACFSRPGFIHALVAFTASSIVINTLSTFMDYLVRLNGASRDYVGIVGGSFQFVIMISSLIIGTQTDKTRAYYSVIIGMLVLGAFGLAECGVSLDADRGGDLRLALILVACLVGPLQPVSTELGVEVAYPLSENTVLVIQQLFSNLLSALFIPFFKALKDIGTAQIDATELYERPAYTFSFYLLIVIHAAVTVFFATFNGRYLRYEHELIKKAEEERARGESVDHEDPVQGDFNDSNFERSKQVGHYAYQREAPAYPNERMPLIV